MGYRELLKKYLRFVEAQAGDHFIDSIGYGVEPAFSDRELGELRALIGDLTRTSESELVRGRMPGFNYRLRLLSICYGLTLQEIADLSATDVTIVRRWRTNPHSRRYVEMREDEFTRFERALYERRVCVPGLCANPSLVSLEGSTESAPGAGAAG